MRTNRLSDDASLQLMQKPLTLTGNYGKSQLYKCKAEKKLQNSENPTENPLQQKLG